MRIGIISDIHFSYSHGNKVAASGVNQRESDVYYAAFEAAMNLIDAEVEAVVDLGDMAHVPTPKKRALLSLIDLLKFIGIPYYSANGNHTLQRLSTDMHLYEVLSTFRKNFHGFVKPGMTPFGGYLIPYGNEEQIKRAIDDMPSDAVFIGGHWAAEDVPFPGSHIKLADLPNIPVFLGHYHTRKVNDDPFSGPVYVGATERYAWGEWQNPTGIAIFDTETKSLEFIDHETREWVDIVADPENYLEDSLYEGINDKIARLTIYCSPAQYNSLDLVAVKKKLSNSLEYQLRRGANKKEERSQANGSGTFSLITGWQKHIASARIPRGISKKKVEEIGVAALSDAGGV